MKHLFLIAAILTAGMLFSSPLVAQEVSDWKKTCVDANKAETCRISQVRIYNKEVDGKQQPVGKILGLTVLYATDAKTSVRAPYMSIQMPLGVDLRGGAVFRVDAGKEISVPYLQCTNAGCDASYPLDSVLIKQMKAGKTLTVGFRAWGNVKVTAVNASLKGFTKAFGALK